MLRVCSSLCSAPFLVLTKIRQLQRFLTKENTFHILLFTYVCMYVYSRGGPQTAPAPRPSLIYCAFLFTYINTVNLMMYFTSNIIN
jgi:hypothetical protein